MEFKTVRQEIDRIDRSQTGTHFYKLDMLDKAVNDLYLKEGWDIFSVDYIFETQATVTRMITLVRYPAEPIVFPGSSKDFLDSLVGDHR